MSRVVGRDLAVRRAHVPCARVCTMTGDVEVSRSQLADAYVPISRALAFLVCLMTIMIIKRVCGGS